MNLKSVNKALYRPIKSGAKYNKYFPITPCRATNLGNGDTTFTLQLMAEMVVRYQEQTKNIAPLLKANTLPKTVDNIYRFLYDHLQYNADGYEQNLRSPACSWQTRQTGIDCKSYSLFALSILYNLGISAKFRKITQPSSPNIWSHVYVVIPNGSAELIIDATKKVNTEPTKILQEDMQVNLPHTGLNGYNSSAMTARDIEIVEAIDNLQNDFLPMLESRGVSKETTARILAEVKRSLQNSIDPMVSIDANSISINKIIIPFGVNFQGLGFLGPATLSAVSGVVSSDFFSSLFSKSASGESNKRIIAPMQEKIETELSSANKGNIHLIVTDLDKHLNALISHETKVGSRFSKEALPKLKEQLKLIRNEFKNLNPISKTSSDKFPDTWSNKGSLKHSGTYRYLEYQMSNVFTTPTYSVPITPNQNTGFDFNGLVSLGNNLFKNPQTGSVVTGQQAQQVVAEQNAGNLPNSKNKDYTKPILISVGVLAVVVTGVVVAKKKNLF